MNQPPYPPYASPALPPPYVAPPPYGYGYVQPPAPVQSAWGGAAQPAIGTGGSSLRWFILASLLGAGFCVVAGAALTGAAENPDDTLATIGSLVILAAFPAIAAYFTLVLVWIAKSWAMLPPMARMTQTGRVISPGQAVGFLFIPFFNLYWYFVVSMGLCEALNRQLAAYGSPKRAPRGLALAASVIQVIPYVNFGIGPLLWLPFMFMADGAKREYARLSAAPA